MAHVYRERPEISIPPNAHIESAQGFSFWVANDRFSVQEQTGPKAGTVIRSLYLNDSMTLMPCTPEEAEKCLTESGMALSEPEPRGQLELQSE